MRERWTWPSSRVFRAALIAPQPWWPSTTKRSMPRCAPAYCKLPAISGEKTFPATRMTNKSPSPTSKTSSGGTRESLQPRIVANGRWADARMDSDSCRSPAKLASPETNLSFPAINRRRESGGIIDVPMFEVLQSGLILFLKGDSE